MVHAGKMRHQITIEVRSQVQDAAGEPQNVWNVFATVRAEELYTPGREIWASAQRAARVPAIFKIRYLEGVTPAMRLIFNGRVHNILSAIDPDNGRKLEMVLTTEEWVEETP